MYRLQRPDCHNILAFDPINPPECGVNEQTRRSSHHSHAVEQLPVRLVTFALGHQAVQFVDQLRLHLSGQKTKT